MRVLHVITSLDDGGAEAVLYRLIAHDPADEHHVVSLTGDGKYGTPLRQMGARVTALDMPRRRVTLQGVRGLWRVASSWRADVVQTWMYHADFLGGVAGRLAGMPVVWGIRNSTLKQGGSSRTTIWMARLCAWLSRWVPIRIVACAEGAVQVHAALGYDAARMVLIPNGYDVSHFAPDANARARLRAEWSIPDDLPLIGMVARFDAQKDHANFIAALAYLRAAGVEFGAVLVGTCVTTANRALVDQIAAKCLVDRVRLLGPRQDIPAVMSALDLHVLPSAYGEAFPNVLAEAMACGTPCVTTDVGDAARIVGDTGWVVPPRCPEALAAAIQRALEAKTDATGWSVRKRRARQRIVEEFGLDRMMERYRAVWTEACQFRLIEAKGFMGWKQDEQ